jgi:23S rRNA A1618 N6-methylase RlmF
MCNPPFYASAREMERSAATKALPPRAVLTASANELLTAGGEVQFVGRMIDESLVLKTQCRYVCC